MSRPFSRIKLGYYPLPVEETLNIRMLLIPSGAYSAIDPCAGDGTALTEITKDTGAHVRAIELDVDRGSDDLNDFADLLVCHVFFSPSRLPQRRKRFR